MRLSVIIPALDEADTIVPTLRALQWLRQARHELILVDGGSQDDTVARATPWIDKVIQSPRGRARQMNRGAQQASGEILLFLHADTLAPPGFDRPLMHSLQVDGRHWGRFDVRLSGTHPLMRVVERMMNLRSRLTGIATGDQGIFVDRQAFEAVGGYADLPLMEDIALSRTLKCHFGRPACLRQRLVTSSRRWERHGVIQTILLMGYLRLAYRLGADPHNLARLYR